MAGRRGAHRKEHAGAVKSRLMIAAMAAGATAAGAYSLGNPTETHADDTILASEGTHIEGASVTGSVDGMQIVSVSSTADTSVHAEEITKAAAFAQERAEREARLSRPLFVMPTKGYVWTSNFGYRLGRAARRHRPGEPDRHPDRGGLRRRRDRLGPDRAATAPGSSCATPMAPSRSTATSTPGSSARVTG